MSGMIDELASADDALEWIYGLPRFGAGTGLHRVEWLASAVLSGGAGRLPPSIRVTGSNGKGSVARMTASVLEALGLTVGLYTSPHLVRFEERFQLGGREIEPAELAELSRWCEARVADWHRLSPGDQVGRFEAITAMALRFFATHPADVVVAEAGIGGRFDPVRFFAGLTVGMSSVELEHTEVLGSTLEQIAFDKADLCPPGGTLFVAAADPTLVRRLAAYTRLRGTEVVPLADAVRVENVRVEGDGMRADFSVGGIDLPNVEIGMLGRHQVGNAALAVALCRDWMSRAGPRFGGPSVERAIREGLRTARWPGRLERIAADPEIWIDVGHTPLAIESTVRTMVERGGGRPLTVLLGVSHDKDVAGIVRPLARAAARVVCTRAHHKGSPAAHVARELERCGYAGPVEVVEPIEAAVARVAELARESGDVVLVAGGLFLAVEAGEVVQGRDPARLRFI
jgi:dihydrofolate synthase/folylpolyglutamate synthase